MSDERVTDKVGLDRGMPEAAAWIAAQLHQWCGKCNHGYITLYSPHPHRRRCTCNPAKVKDADVVITRAPVENPRILQNGTTDSAHVVP